jgi:uncharacterized protein (DUF302 family)
MKFRALLPLLLLIPALAWADSDLVKKKSVHTVQETMDRLEEVVSGKGLTVLARIDHRANAESVGKKLPDSQVLIFGNPKAGTRVMLHDLAAGLDLPMRVLVYSDFDGNTWLVYHNPQGLKALFAVEECKVLEQLEKGLNAMTDRAVE